MRNDFNGADRVFLATGFTDLRRGIVGLASIVQQQFELDPFTNTLFLFVADVGTRSRRCTGKAMDLCCFTSGLSPVLSNGHGLKQKPKS